MTKRNEDELLEMYMWQIEQDRIAFENYLKEQAYEEYVKEQLEKERK